MCGIAAVLHTDYQIRKDELRRSLEGISHRGQASHQFEISDLKNQNLSLGTNRLAIVSKNDQSQPVHSLTARFTIVFNGEVFNYKDLMEEIWKGDETVRLLSDTEVLAAAFDMWGVKATTLRLNWEGAFICVDHERRQIIVCRDHLGIKPIYFASIEGGVIWGSEIKAIVRQNGADINPVPPGSIMIFDVDQKNQIETSFWWQPERFARQDNVRAAETTIVEECQTLLRRAVQDRVPDGNCAILLSGGVDSSLVLAFAREVNRNISAYVLQRPSSPDLPFARRLCENLKVSLKEVAAPSPEELSTLITESVRVLETWEWHVINHAAPMFTLVSRIASDSHRVMLSGEGADELFIGYRPSVDGIEWPDIKHEQLVRISDLHKTNCRRLDRVSMNSTIESRVPFLDRSLTEFALNLHPSWLCRNGFNKWILRKVAEKIIGPDFAWRKKMSFARGVGYNYEFAGVFGNFDCESEVPDEWSELVRFPIEKSFVREFLTAGYGPAKYLRKRSI